MITGMGCTARSFISVSTTSEVAERQQQKEIHADGPFVANNAATSMTVIGSTRSDIRQYDSGSPVDPGSSLPNRENFLVYTSHDDVLATKELLVSDNSLRQFCSNTKGIMEMESYQTIINLQLACSKCKDIDLAKKLYVHICEAGLDMVLEDYVVSMFAGCGLLALAEHCFHKLTCRSEHAWTALITGYMELGDSENAFSWYKRMQAGSVQPSIVTFMALLKSSINSTCRESTQQFHSHIVEEGFENDLFIGSILVNAYSKFGLIVEAEDVFTKLPVQDVVSWTALISGYAEIGLTDEVLHCFDRMKCESGVPPNVVTCVCGLKACCMATDADRGKQIHAMILKYGFEDNIFVESSLIDMYGKCGCLPEAQKVFDSLSVGDIVSWTALLAGYAEHGFDEEVLHLLERMRAHGVAPNAATFACILRSYGNVGTAREAYDVHSEVVKQGFDRDHLVGSAVVDMYAKCGLLMEAAEVSANLSIRDVILLNTLLAGYLEHGFSEEALSCCRSMQQEGIRANAMTWAGSLRACSMMAAAHKTHEIHIEIIKLGGERESIVAIALVDSYASCGLLLEAEHLSICLEMRCTLSWNGLIWGHAEHGFSEDALELYWKMQAMGIPLDSSTFICCLKACGDARMIDTGREVHIAMIKHGFDDIFSGSMLVDFYVKCGLLADAHVVFNAQPVRDVVMWNTIVAGYAEHGAQEEVIASIGEMESECSFWNVDTFACCLKACCSIGHIDQGRLLHSKMVKTGLETHPCVGGTLVDLYAKWGSILEAKKMFESLHVRDMVSWTALFSGYTDCGEVEDVWNLMQRMCLEGQPFNIITIVSILKAIRAMGSIDMGREVHIKAIKLGFEDDRLVRNSLMDMYVKCGSLAEAEEAFAKLPVRDVVAWTAVISRYLGCGSEEKALHCLEQLWSEGMVPDGVILGLSLKACGRLGDLDLGQELHIEISKKGLDTNPFIGISLLDMYAKCALLVEARNIFDSLLVKDVTSWNALANGYIEQGLAEEVLACYEEMHCERVSADAIMAMTSLKACGTIGALDRGRKVHIEAAKAAYNEEFSPGMDPFAAGVGLALVEMYCKCGSMSDAHGVFNKMSRKEVVMWNALVGGYSRHGDSAAVFALFNQMQNEGIHPDDVCFLCVLTACSHGGLVVEGQIYLQCLMDKYQISPAIKHYNCLVDLFGRAGCANEAMAMVESVPVPFDSVAWSTMLAACRKWGNVEASRQAFKRSVQLGPHRTGLFLLMCGMYADVDMEED